MVLYLAADLIWATRIKATGEAIGVACRPARDGAMLRARLADSPVRGLIVDLEAGPVALELIAALRGPEAGERERALAVTAFAPHVHTDAMEAAARAGAEAVLARGAFDRRLPDILREMDRGGSSPEGR